MLIFEPVKCGHCESKDFKMVEKGIAECANGHRGEVTGMITIASTTISRTFNREQVEENMKRNDDKLRFAYSYHEPVEL
jgi:hypothetical protein